LAFLLTVNGSNFVNGGSVVRWDGADRPTTFVSAAQLTASDIAAAGIAPVTVQNPVGASTALPFTITQAAPAPTLTSIAVTPANPTIQTGATQQFTATGIYSDGSTQNITSQVTWASSTTVATINGSGLATAGASAGSTTISATLSGTVVPAGSTTLTVQAAPAPLAITTSSLPDARVGVVYEIQPGTPVTLAATGGTPPYAWSISSGSLPPGLSLTLGTGLNLGVGVIGGTPLSTASTAAPYRFTEQVSDAVGAKATKAFTIKVRKR
jgi:hypothetical protein